jgi:hypothetical protein
MSYARFSEGDVYVFLNVGGTLECCGCSLGDRWDFDSTDAMLEHLREHAAAGHAIPDRCIPGLEEDREENDAFIKAGGRSA